MKPTWQQLLDLEPGLRQWQDDARSIAREARWNWFPRWIGNFRDLRRVLHDVARRHGLDFQEVHRAAVDALLDVYDVARAREQRRRSKRSA
jgi:hypothetical protein